ncbi:MAG: FAD:protein FMN transferase [Alphaproteobacteria bacterium]|nr:FAD:protein FMN transferase [Alphaproteobacteria bacterium]
MRMNSGRGELLGSPRTVEARATRSMLSRRRVLIIIGAVAGLPLLPCADLPADAARLHRWQGTSLGSPSYILLHHPDRGVADRAVADCVAEIERLEKQFGLYRSDSEIARLNSHGRLEAPSHDFLTLLSECQRFYELSGGAFDVTVQPLWDLYAAHFFGSANPPPEGPEQRVIEQALTLVGWAGVDITSRHVAVARRGMALTLNGIAQGYLTDRIVDILHTHGCDRVLADMGRSEIRLVGQRPDGEAWRVGIADPLAPTRVAVTLELADRCVSTSGGYGTRFEATGRHHHLFDPKTGTSASHYIAVTVVAGSTMVADALSTALYVTPPEDAGRLLAAFPGAEVLVTRPDGSQQKLPG